MTRRRSPLRGVAGCAAVAVALSVVFQLLVAPPATGQGAVTHDHGPRTVEARDTNCANSGLGLHDGFQEAPLCVQTNFGEVADAARNPTLLIASSPNRVRSGESFRLRISTRNLERSRFLPAAQGGYYAEGAQLNDAGITEGHAHVACRTLASTRVAPDPAPAPAFFQAVEDGQGGAAPDTVTVNVPGRNAQGAPLFPPESVVQCAVWAGDGSHRTPMMQRANQTPAFDAVRIRVGGPERDDGDDRDRRKREDRED